MSSMLKTGRGQQRQSTVAQTIESFDDYQTANSSPTLDSMDHNYLSTEFSGDLINYFNKLIDEHTDGARSGIEAKIKTTMQAIGEQFPPHVLDNALKEQTKMGYAEFKKMIMERVTKELSLQRDLGIRASDVAMCRTLPVVSRVDDRDHRYAINLPIVSFVSKGCF
jgi:hypothetical protein